MSKLSKFVLSIIFGVAGLWATYGYFTSKTNDSAVSMYAVFDQSKVGEASMVGAVSQALPLVCDTFAFVTRNETQFKDLKPHLDLDKAGTIIMITAGQFGVNFLKSMIPLKKVKVLLCAHQWFDAMASLHDIYLTMPNHAINGKIRDWAKQQKIELIPTQGVLHTMSVKSLNGQDPAIIHLTEAKVGLILGGDAEMLDGKNWQLFSPENAKKLATEVATLIKQTGYKFLITNGPRTGAFINLTTRDPNAHKSSTKEGSADGSAVDKVSKAFLDELTKVGLKEGEDFEFYDFQFGTPSALKAILAIIYKNKGFMIVPGESTSTISEITAIMPTVIYRNDAMNDVHEAYLADLTRNKVAVLWPNIPSAQQVNVYAPLKPQAITVLQRMLNTSHR